MTSILKSVTFQDFDHICRTCLGSEKVCRIADTTVCGLKVADLLQFTITIEVTKEDQLPPNVCVSCLKQLYKIHEFKKKCLNYETVLRVLLDNPKSNYIEDEVSCNITLVENVLDPPDDVSNNEEEKTCESSDAVESEIQSAPVETDKNDSTPNEIANETEEEKEYKCKNCDYTSVNLVDFRHHQKTNHRRKKRSQNCPICDKVVTVYRIEEHMRTHTAEKPFECDQCFARFNQKGNLRRHQMKHTGERPHVCHICGKGFIQGPSLRTHLKTHQAKETRDPSSDPYKYTCETCGHRFKRFRNYSVHLSRHEHHTPQTGPAEPRNYICDVCAKTYRTHAALKAHQLTHQEKSFLCSKCGKGFFKSTALQIHLKLHTGVKPHVCLVCNKSFAQIGSLDSHMLVHTGFRPYKCNFCDKTFKQLTHKNYHLRTHSGERPYVCGYCNKSFALKGNLTVHIRTHTGEKPYVCSVCGKGFHDSSSMKKHKRNHKVVSENGEYEVSLDKMPVALDVIV